MKKRRDTITLAYVRWLDASHMPAGQYSTEELTPDVRRCHLESAGLLVGEDDKTITLALDWYSRDKNWRYISHIPKVNCVAIRRVKVTRHPARGSQGALP